MNVKRAKGGGKGASESPIGEPPPLKIRKLAIVSRNYNKIFPNGHQDFSHVWPELLEHLDDERCDAVLFSLYTIGRRRSFDAQDALRRLKHVKAVFVEEYRDDADWSDGRFVVHYRARDSWKEYRFGQVFGSLKGAKESRIDIRRDFVEGQLSGRMLGNSCVLLCGETNGVKYSPRDKKVHDEFGLKRALSEGIELILNPVHDRMTRFEMPMKRRFLSGGGRCVVSVWNKGKKFKSGKGKKTRKEAGPAWTIFHDRSPVAVEIEQPISNRLGVEIGILDVHGM